MTSRDEDLPAEPSSPACAMHEADDAYMGYAGRPELLAFLTLLLQAERAGALVARHSAEAAGTGEAATLLNAIAADEARWCAMLARHITALGGVPGDAVGEFRDKAMAIENLAERIGFLNRGQRWVVRKLEEMLPRVRADQLHADLRDMARSHAANIERAEGFSEPPG